MQPTKNNIIDAKEKYESIGDAMSASSGEHAIYYANRCYLQTCNQNAKIELQEAKEKEVINYLFFDFFILRRIYVCMYVCCKFFTI